MKVTLWMAMSVNGIIADINGGEDFLSHDNWLEFVDAVQKVGCLIWGRKTYELVRKWLKSYLDPLENITKIILTHDKKVNLDKGFIPASSPKEAIEILSKKGFNEVILTGGSTNNASFAKLNLINELNLHIEPVILGQGIPLFHTDLFELKLELLEMKKSRGKTLELRFKVSK